MAADVAKFSAAVDKVYKTFSTQEVHLDREEMKGLGERGTMQYIEQRFQQQLQRARSAFLQEFRNHSVVVESEVKKIREQLTEALEEKYGEKIANLKKQAAECSALVSKHRDEISHLKSLATAQEAYLIAVRHRWGLEQRERLRAEIQSLRDDLQKSARENADLSHQLMCRDELVAQLRGELSGLEAELKKQAGIHQEDKRNADERLRGLRLEMRQQQDQFKEHLRSYEERFSEYREKTTDELHIQDILNNRRSEALAQMEEERQRHIKARTKPSPRIGEEQEEDEDSPALVPYTLVKSTRYRVDDLGMDTSWRDYQLSSEGAAPPPLSARTGRMAIPKFKVDKQVDKARGVIVPNTSAPRTTESVAASPRSTPGSHGRTRLPPTAVLSLPTR